MAERISETAARPPADNPERLGADETVLPHFHAPKSDQHFGSISSLEWKRRSLPALLSTAAAGL
jgi:hypothetical protein